ncbi:OmpH family outer membrane protein [Spirochaeta lutea]|nr:OmpH family outer membrane protein [Spirochaeta lutea]
MYRFNMKLVGLIALLLFGTTFSGWSEQLTTVGVVDTESIYLSYFSDSAAVRQLEALRNEIQSELDSHAAELRRLQEQKLSAESQGNESLALRLDEEIFQKAQFIRDFQRVKTQQLEQRQRSLSQSDDFLRRLQEAIRLEAESSGFTIIIDAKSQGLQWWSREVDITNKVLDRLR